MQMDTSLSLPRRNRESPASRNRGKYTDRGSDHGGDSGEEEEEEDGEDGVLRAGDLSHVSAVSGPRAGIDDDSNLGLGRGLEGARFNEGKFGSRGGL